MWAFLQPCKGNNRLIGQNVTWMSQHVKPKLPVISLFFLLGCFFFFGGAGGGGHTCKTLKVKKIFESAHTSSSLIVHYTAGSFWKFNAKGLSLSVDWIWCWLNWRWAELQAGCRTLDHWHYKVTVLLASCGQFDNMLHINSWWWRRTQHSSSM